MKRVEIHECLHEVDFAKIAADIEHIKESQLRVEKKQGDVLGILFGNGKRGFKTQIMLNRYMIGVAISGLTALAGYFFYHIK